MYNPTTGELNPNICPNCKQIIMRNTYELFHYCWQQTDGGSLTSGTTMFYDAYGVRRDYSKVIGHIKYNDR